MSQTAPPATGVGICVMGRNTFGTGIGLLTESFMELLARKYDVHLFDIHGVARPGETVRLTSGREVPVAHRLDGYAVYVYADVLWNGVNYTEYVRPPASGYRIAYLAFDSDRLPPEWVEILNSDFDAVFFTSPHLIESALESGVAIEIGALPLALDIETQIARRYRPPAGRRVRFGTLSAYHPRKGLEDLVSAFLREFGESPDVELVIHSNIAIGDTAAAVRSMVEVSRTGNVVLSTENLTETQKNQLLETFDVYVNASAGEGYSVGPREALAMGKAAVLTDLGAHAPLFAAPGVFPVRALHEAPAVYPEIDNRQFGFQQVPDPESLRDGLRRAFEFVRSDEAVTTAGERKLLAAEFGLQSLERSYWALVDPDSMRLRPDPVSRQAVIPPSHQEKVRSRAGRNGVRLGATRLVVPALDAGFFSLFNTYLSHLVWSMHDSPQRLVLPDWDAGRLLERMGDAAVVSYCYSRPDQGNLWNHLFEPPYDLAPGDLDDPDLLWGPGAETPTFTFNESREPLLTYIHAFRLYQNPDFARIRRQYQAVIRDHVRLREPLQAELDQFLTKHRDGRFLVAAHVKHPSHVVEQPDSTMADRHTYVALVRQALAERGIREAGDDWAVFLATDQERVVDLFHGEFGDHVIRFSDVERVPTETDERFDELPTEMKAADGHQLQHQMAADVARWSPRLAWEVIRDARVMASADVLFHAVSNVATAVSFMGPDVDMRFAAA